ncbi:MAG: hypothetical protein GC171_05235 [Terrimonas sp.]|nr:hypothetical protein [Terrimonas sp.]
MKKLKLADMLIGTLLILICTIMGLVKRNGQYIFTAYFIVGGWQLISMIAHLFLKKKYIRIPSRKTYEVILLILLATGLLCFGLAYLDIPIFWYYLYLMLFLPPLLAIFYHFICYKEYQLLAKKELIHLKN